MRQPRLRAGGELRPLLHRDGSAIGPGTFRGSPPFPVSREDILTREEMVNGLIYLIGLIVVVMFILSFLGLR